MERILMDCEKDQLSTFKTSVVEKTKQYAKSKLLEERTGHDWWHTYRVWKMACKISETEEVDRFIVEIAALLHDIADWKLHGGNTDISDQLITAWLNTCDVQETDIINVKGIINSISFKGAKVAERQDLSLEAKVVQDADRLDAIGAIGIARLFTYGGNFNRKIHDPNKEPILHESSNEYLNSESTSINHFYEKLLLVKDRINTKTGRKLAKKRHEYLVNYLEEFFLEWEGER